MALTAATEKAFPQIEVQQEDGDGVRLLWFAGEPTLPFDLEDLQEWRMTRVPFVATSSAFLLSGTIQYHLKNGAADKHIAKKVAKLVLCQ